MGAFEPAPGKRAERRPIVKRLCLFAAVAGLSLVSAAPPERVDGSGVTGTGGYPPCSRTVTDRCIQLYERGVATAENLALNERLGPGRVASAMGGPYEAAPVPEGDDWRPAAGGGDYPPCSATVTDRCIQLYERGVRRRR